MAIWCTFFYSCVTFFYSSVFIVAIRTIGNELSKVSILFTFQWDGKYKSFYGIRFLEPFFVCLIFHFLRGWKELFWTPFGEFLFKKICSWCNGISINFQCWQRIYWNFGILIMSFDKLIKALSMKILFWIYWKIDYND